MRILVVEDERVSRRIISKYLSDFGECDFAENGEKAIESYIASHNENNPYRLISLDIQMPKLDGQEVLKEIRKFEYDNDIYGYDGVKIIMTTVLSDNINIMEAFRSQCEAYITKPVERKKLYKELESLGIKPQ